MPDVKSLGAPGDTTPGWARVAELRSARRCYLAVLGGDMDAARRHAEAAKRHVEYGKSVAAALHGEGTGE